METELTSLYPGFDMSNSMYELGKKHGTDKVTHHEYHEIYPLFIEKFYQKDGAMLEIGLDQGASLNMWLELFPKMHIYGMDLDFEGTTERSTIIKGDQSREADLSRVVDSIKHPLYFINDDGSHIPEHQVLTFNKLFPILEIGGVYIIEDIETSYWTRSGLYGYKTRYGVGHRKSLIEAFKSAVDGVNFEFSSTRKAPLEHQDSIQSITFSRNCVIITKKEPGDRTYRYPNKVRKLF